MVTKLNFKKVLDNENCSKCTDKPFYRQLSNLIQIFVFYVKTRTPPVYCFPIATVLSFLLISKDHILEDVVVAFGIGMTSYLLALATYVYNDLTDIDVDQINRKEQSVITQNQSRGGLIILVISLFTLAATISYVISFNAFLISIIFIVLGIFYSHPKFSLKSKFPLKTIVTATGAGLLSLLGGAAAIGNGSEYNTLHNTITILPLPTIYVAFSFSIFYFIQSPIGDIADITGDRAAGRKTFPLVLGMNRTLGVMLSVPFIMLTMNGLCFNLVHISIHGTISIIGTSLLVVGFIGWISNRLHNPSFIKSKRNYVRYLNILMQISLLIALI